MTNDATLPDHVLSVRIRAPIERVWREITKTGSVQQAVYNTVLETSLEPGARLRYYNPDKSRVFVVGEILESTPPVRLRHTYWFTTWRHGGPTEVTWELEQQGDECLVKVTHTGWTEAHEKYGEYGKGWQEILDLLKTLLETGRLPLKVRFLYGLMNLFSFLLPKTTRPSYADEQGW